MANPEQLPELTYRQRVMKTRKAYDLYPWLEVYDHKWNFTNNDTAPAQQHPFQHKQPRSLLVSELVHGNIFLGVNADKTQWLSTDVPGSSVQFTQGTSGEGISTAPMDSRQYLGDLFDEMKRFRTGVSIPTNDVRTLVVRVGMPEYAETFTTNDYRAWVGMRGYKLQPKGTIHPAQLTYAEYAQRGYRLEPFTPVLSVSVKTATTDTAEVEFTMPHDFACDFLTLTSNLQADGGLSGDDAKNWNVQCKLESPVQPIMDDFLPMPLLGSIFERTAWRFEQPLTTLKNETWKFKVKLSQPHDYSDSYATTLEKAHVITLAMHGNRLVAPGAA